MIFFLDFLVDWCTGVTCFYNEDNPEKKTNQRGRTLQPDTSSSLNGRRSKSLLFTNHFLCILFGWVILALAQEYDWEKFFFFTHFSSDHALMPNASRPFLVYLIMQPCLLVMVHCLHHFGSIPVMCSPLGILNRITSTFHICRDVAYMVTSGIALTPGHYGP